MSMRPPAWLADHYRNILLLLFIGLAPLTTLRLYAIDEIENFVYLRSAVFDRDLDFADEYGWFVDRDPVQYQALATAFLHARTPAGHPPNNAPIGSAVLWSVLYVPTVLVEALTGRGSSPPGYSAADIKAVCVASMLYGVLGLLLAHDACRRFASARAAFWSTVMIWLGSNLLFYMYVTPPMSHAGSFFVSALLLWAWLRAAREPRAAVKLGLLGGLLASVRWQDALFMLTPVSAPIVDGSIRQRGGVRRWLTSSSLMGAGFCVAFLPQLLVWWRLNGSLGPYGMMSPGESRFSFAAPHFLGVLFSPFHGLFVWTPILLPAFIGLGVMAAADGRGRAIAIGVAAQLYLISGYAVAFGHGFGQRLFVSSLPAMALGLAVFIDRVARKLPGALTVVGAVICVWWNLSLMVQHSLGIVPRNQGVSLGTLIHNQLVEVPRRLPDAVWRYVFHRSSFYNVDPARGPVRE
jgi:hypothetical protein